MQNRNFNVSIYPNSPEFLNHISQFNALLAISDEDKGDYLVALLNPIELNKPERASEALRSGRLLAASGQLYRAAEAMMEALKRFNEVGGGDGVFVGPLEDFDAKFAMLKEYIEAERPHAVRGARVDLPIYF